MLEQQFSCQWPPNRESESVCKLYAALFCCDDYLLLPGREHVTVANSVKEAHLLAIICGVQEFTMLPH